MTKATLCCAPALQQSVTEGSRAAAGVLAQEHGGAYRPVAYLSKTLDLVVQGLPACLRAVAAATLLVQTAGKVLSHTSNLHTSHQVNAISNNIKMQHDSSTKTRILGYSLYHSNITIKPTSVPNTPTVQLYCLINSAEPDTENIHNRVAKSHISLSLHSKEPTKKAKLLSLKATTLQIWLPILLQDVR